MFNSTRSLPLSHKASFKLYSRHDNMFRETARNTIIRRIAITKCGPSPVYLRGMTNEGVEDATESSGEAENSSPKVDFWHSVEERLAFSETTKYTRL